MGLMTHHETLQEAEFRTAVGSSADAAIMRGPEPPGRRHLPADLAIHPLPPMGDDTALYPLSSNSGTGTRVPLLFRYLLQTAVSFDIDKNARVCAVKPNMNNWFHAF